MRVPSGQWTWAVRTDNCATDFSENFAEKSFLFKSRVRTVRHCRPDGRTSAASNFHIRLSRVQTMGDERPDDWSSTCNFHICYARVRTMIGSRPDGWSRIGNFLNCWTRVRTKADCRPDGDIWIVILTFCMSAFGWESTLSGRLKQSSLKLNLERIWSWSITERRSNGLLRRPDGCKLEQ
jgi:hypothetical protein